MHIFIDSSVSQQKNKAVGAYAILNNLDDLVNLQFVEFESDSSTIAEFLTIKHVLEKINIPTDTTYLYPDKTYLYTDCENFVNLIDIRRYKANLKKHRNYQLYSELIALVDLLNIEVIWCDGHLKKELKTEKYQQIFSEVDQYAREKLREL